MYLERKEDLSIYYWLKGLFTNTPITVLDAFPEGDFIYPSVSIDALSSAAINFELGSRIRQHYRNFSIEIFALTKTQRDEIGYKIYNELDNTIPVYDYDEGFPPSVSPTEISSLSIENKNLENLFVDVESVKQMYYRATIYFVATRNTR